MEQSCRCARVPDPRRLRVEDRGSASLQPGAPVRIHKRSARLPASQPPAGPSRSRLRYPAGSSGRRTRRSRNGQHDRFYARIPGTHYPLCLGNYLDPPWSRPGDPPPSGVGYHGRARPVGRVSPARAYRARRGAGTGGIKRGPFADLNLCRCSRGKFSFSHCDRGVDGARSAQNESWREGLNTFKGAIPMRTNRRDLLLSAGAAVLAKKAQGQGSAPISSEPAWKKLFPAGFRNERIKTTGAEINAVIGGSGPPVLMFHGAPQSLITWRLIAPNLAKDYTLVMCDLRGYGDSSRPPGGGDHSDYSKRTMALDGVEVMKHLGYNQFRMVGHDRGGRVGRRMAIDHPETVTKLAVMDIVPAHYLYSHVTFEFVQAYFHWFNYLRPAPGPEDDLKKAADAQMARATNEIQI